MPNTIIASQLAVDPALVQDANYKFGRVDRRYIDDQIRAIEQLLVDSLINGKHGSYYDLDGSSPALIAGDCVCLASSPDGTVTKALTTPLIDAGAVLGVVINAASPGGKVFVAFGGTIPPSITGLPTSSPGFAKVDPATARLVFDAAAVGYTVGTVDNAGWLQISVRIAAYGTPASAGATDEIQTNDGAGGFGAATNVKATNWHLQIGTPASALGDIGHAGNTRMAMTRNVADTADYCAMATDGSDNLIIGGSNAASNADGYVQLFINPASFGYLSTGGSLVVQWDTVFRSYVPVVLGSLEASQGDLRFTSAGSKAFVRNNTNTGDLCIWDMDETADRLWVGGDRNQASEVSSIGLYASTTVYLGIGGSTKLWILSTELQVFTPKITFNGTTTGRKIAQEAELNTTDNTAHPLLTVDVTSPTPLKGTGNILDITVMGVETGGAAIHWFKKSRAWLNLGGVLTAGAQKDIDDEIIGVPVGTWTCAITDDGVSNIIVNVNGDNDNVSWYVVSQTLSTYAV